MDGNKCQCCGKHVPIEEAFTIRHGKEPKWNMATLCEPCCDKLLAEQEAV